MRSPNNARIRFRTLLTCSAIASLSTGVLVALVFYLSPTQHKTVGLIPVTFTICGFLAFVSFWLLMAVFQAIKRFLRPTSTTKSVLIFVTVALSATLLQCASWLFSHAPGDAPTSWLYESLVWLATAIEATTCALIAHFGVLKYWVPRLTSRA